MRRALKYVLLIPVLLAAYCLVAQKQANIWYFGRHLGLDFNSGAPIPLNDGKLNTTEGVATICDNNGRLLFYTEGTIVWNRLHEVMPNGRGLFGSYTSTQSAIIVPFIGDTTRYYVFTVDAESGPRGLTYSIVNMTLDNGKGDIEQKNVPLVSNVVEKITAVRHCNNRDVWVITHKSVSDAYYAYLVTPAGINTTPVISNTGSVLWGVRPPSPADSTSLGYLKASPDGKRIAAAHWTVNADVSDFDNATGIVSNSYSLFQPTDPRHLVYGIEFSPNSKLVYTTAFYTDPVTFLPRNVLYQYDVTLATPAAVRASKQVISRNSDDAQTYAALQIGPDGKMYMAKNTYTHIAAINNPDVYGPGCNYVSNAIEYTMMDQKSSFGLPTFIQSYFYPADSFTYNIACPGSLASFNYVLKQNVASVRWEFDDPASGANNISTLNNPTHNFSAPGTYKVKLIKFTNCGPDTLRATIQTDAFSLDLGLDTIVCGGNSVLLSPTGAGSTYQFLWQDGSANPTLLATAPGLYWVEVKNTSGCTRRDSINVSFKPSPVFSLGADAAICQSTLLSLNASAANADSYLWNNGSTSPSLIASQPGLYWCQANKGGCRYSDSINISVKPMPPVDLGNDVTVCEGISVTLNASYPNATYQWQDGSANPIYNATRPGTYFVQVNLDGCKKSDTVKVAHNLKPAFTLGPDQTICAGKTILLRPALNPAWQLSWQDGSNTPAYTITAPGTFSLTATNTCGATTDEIVITKGACKVSVPNVFTPNNDRKNDQFIVLGVETVTSFHLQVFNRWGQKVFETNDKSRGWDGKIKGVDAPTGGFVYILKYTDISSPQIQMVKGTLLLIR